MNFENWVESLKFRLKQRYQITDIKRGDCGLRIRFKTNFAYGINEYALKELWRRDAFEELCKDIENVYVKQIINI